MYGEESVKLSEGDTILLYTDGVTEARNGNVFFGEERVRENLIAGGTPREVVRRLLLSVRRFSRTDLRDDVALLAIAVRGAENQGSTHEGRFDT
jgi:serine phosphatase RsbU (regulator of sigma subunit)